MARSASSTDSEEYTTEYETGTLAVDDAEELDGREESAHTEHMVVTPVFDEWGEVYEEYEVTTESGSTYTVDPYGDCGCPDMIFNSPEDGCKHIRRVIHQLNAGAIPEPEREVDAYMTERVPALIDEFAEELDDLGEGRTAAEDDKVNKYEEAISEIETFIGTLACAYADYGERVNHADSPVLTDLLKTDTDVSGLFSAEVSE